MRLAIFDFDGTIYQGETFQVMMNHLKSHSTYSSRYKRFIRSVIPRYIGAKLKVYPKNRMREQSMQFYLNALNDLTKTELDTYFAEIATHLRKNYNQEVIHRLKRHMDDGDYVMVVSGAYTQLLQCALNEFKVDAIVGTHIPFHNETIDPSTPIYHVQGERKNQKIMDELKNEHIDWKNSYAYADSYSDLPVLELVGHPVAVQPEKQLQSVAETRHWEIV